VDDNSTSKIIISIGIIICVLVALYLTKDVKSLLALLFLIPVLDSEPIISIDIEKEKGDE
jgi:hypothetical protein